MDEHCHLNFCPKERLQPQNRFWTRGTSGNIRLIYNSHWFIIYSMPSWKHFSASFGVCPSLKYSKRIQTSLPAQSFRVTFRLDIMGKYLACAMSVQGTVRRNSKTQRLHGSQRIPSYFTPNDLYLLKGPLKKWTSSQHCRCPKNGGWTTGKKQPTTINESFLAESPAPSCRTTTPVAGVHLQTLPHDPNVREHGECCNWQNTRTITQIYRNMTICFSILYIRRMKSCWVIFLFLKELLLDSEWVGIVHNMYLGYGCIDGYGGIQAKLT